jgi:hypothetical protein
LSLSTILSREMPVAVDVVIVVVVILVVGRL